MRKPIAAATLCCIAAAAGCGGRAGEWAGTITDSAGVAIVANTNDGIWKPAEQWTLEEELRIGSSEGDPNYQLGQVGTMGVASNGDIYVLDGQARHVKVFSSDGKYVRTLGRPGAGPGEIGVGAAFVLVTSGDTVLVPDLQNRRMNRYGPDGGTLSSFPIAIERGLPLLFRVTRDRRVAEQLRPMPLPNQPAADSTDAIVLLANDGSILDTLLTIPSGRTFNFAGGAPEIKLYSPEPVWEITEDLLVLYGRSDSYRIGVYGQDEVLRRVITKPFERLPVSDRDKDVVMRYLERAWTDAGVPPAVLPQLRSLVKFGESFPAFSTIQTGPAGTIWVQHVQSAAALSEEELANFNLLEDAGAPEWDVFDAEGRFLGMVRMPDRFTPRFFRGNQVYGVWRDELDVPYVMRLRVVGAPVAVGE